VLPILIIAGAASLVLPILILIFAGASSHVLPHPSSSPLSASSIMLPLPDLLTSVITHRKRRKG
jgi:hypothetical protein